MGTPPPEVYLDYDTHNIVRSEVVDCAINGKLLCNRWPDSVYHVTMKAYVDGLDYNFFSWDGSGTANSVEVPTAYAATTHIYAFPQNSLSVGGFYWPRKNAITDAAGVWQFAEEHENSEVIALSPRNVFDSNTRFLLLYKAVEV